MKKLISGNYFFGLFVLLLCYSKSYSQSIPHLQKKGTTQQLIVDGKPFLILGGELGNSTASSLDYMRPFWGKFKMMNLNTILVPAYWDLIEPKEGKFDFILIDSILHISRENNLKVILLWFGSWKNSMSCYAPAWIKTNEERYPRAQNRSGKGLEILSDFSKNNLDADKKAFSKLMKHLKETDQSQTVIMVQVENEIGMLTEAREYTADANKAFNNEVPKELMDYLINNKDSLVPELRAHWAKTNFTTKGNWENVFGKSLDTDELFQAWYYAKYTNAVAAAGKKEFRLPMYVNAALNYRNVQPGQYPSAGPLPHLIDIWQAGAPAIDILSPDFYNPYFKHYCDLYTRRNNPLFIPEIRFEPSNAAKVFYAIGHYQAMGFSPFSIESAEHPEEEPITKSYSILSQLSPQILKYQGTGKMEGVLLDTSTKKQQIVLGNYTLTVSHDYTLGWSSEAKNPDWPMSGAIIIQEGNNDFIIAGTGVVVTFTTNNSNNKSVGILQAEEGIYKEGKWIPGRRMNGDQDHQGRHIRIPVSEWRIQKVKLYQYK
ncbi:MAG: GH35 family beta-galactosidase [Ginsengibacter sp.]